MIIRPAAKFTSDLPAEPTENDRGGGVVRFGGKGVSEAVAELLKGFGCDVERIEYDHDFGWRTHFSWKGRRFSCAVLFIGRYILQTWDTARFSRGFKKNRQIYADALTELARALDGDPRFHDVGWYFHTTLRGDNPGARRPVSLPH